MGTTTPTRQRHLAGAPWASGSHTLVAPVPLHGGDPVLIEAGALGRDEAVLARVLMRHWLAAPTDDGWQHITLYDLAHRCGYELPGLGEYAAITRALVNLATPLVRTGRTLGHLLELQLPAREAGIEPVAVRLSPWLRRGLSVAALRRLSWWAAEGPAAADAKRLWMHLGACAWVTDRHDADVEAAWTPVDSRMAESLDAAPDRLLPARVRRAARVMLGVDARYAVGELEVQRVGAGWVVRSSRPSSDAWLGLRDRHAALVRALA